VPTITAGNFIDFVRGKLYDGITFHRVEPGFVIQGGDPLNKAPGNEQRHGTGGSGKISNWRKARNSVTDSLGRGTVANGTIERSNSASSQFYITLAPTLFLDNPPGYAVSAA